MTGSWRMEDLHSRSARSGLLGLGWGLRLRFGRRASSV